MNNGRKFRKIRKNACHYSPIPQYLSGKFFRIQRGFSDFTVFLRYLGQFCRRHSIERGILHRTCIFEYFLEHLELGASKLSKRSENKTRNRENLKNLQNFSTFSVEYACKFAAHSEDTFCKLGIFDADLPLYLIYNNLLCNKLPEINYKMENNYPISIRDESKSNWLTIKESSRKLNEYLVQMKIKKKKNFFNI